MDKLRGVSDSSKEIENNLLVKRVDDSNKLHNNTNLVLITGTMLAIVLAIIIALACILNIKRGINKITIAAENIAEGVTDIEIDIHSKDEIGMLANTFRKMIESVSSLVTDVNLLVKASVDGKLDTRADASKHGGD